MLNTENDLLLISWAVLCLVLIVAGLIQRAMQRPAQASSRRTIAGRIRESELDTVLLLWTSQDPFRVRDLLNGGCLILGRAGSGKTSSSGRTLMQAIVDHPKSGGLILAAKPEDVGYIKKIFAKAGRLIDLIVFDAEGGRRFSFLDYLKHADTRTVVGCLITIGQTLRRADQKSGDGDNSAFWAAFNERLLFSAVVVLQIAREPINAINLHRFIMGAATKAAELGTPEWKAGYHSTILERAWNAQKTPIEKNDLELGKDFWLTEWPSEDPKTRANVLAGVLGILSVYASGIVRAMVSGETNVSPDDILAGKWVLVDFPPSAWGVAGSFICAGWKYLTEQAILKRQATEDSPFVTIWCDEAHLFANTHDSHFIAQCRSHKGCLVYLSQSVSSFYAALGGGKEHHEADALLANFSHTIIHASDPVTAKWGVSKLGRERVMLFGGGSGPREDEDVLDELMGKKSSFSVSFSEHYEQVLQDQAFMVGRTGGPDNGFLADAILIKSGEPFSSGRNYEFVSFSQC